MSGSVAPSAPMARGRYLGVLALVGAALALGVGAVNNDYWLRIAFMVGVYHLCAAGMSVLVGYAGQKSLGQAGLFAAGAYTAALLSSRTEWDPWLSLLLAAVVSAGFGVLIALPSLRVKGPYLAMVTLAFGIVVEKLVAEWVEVFGGAQGIFGIRPLTWQGAPFTTQQWVWCVLALGLLAHALLRNVLNGRFGRALLSLQADEIAASSVGVRVYRAKVMAFVVAAVMCGLAGALVAQQNQYINSDFIHFHLSIFILLLVLFGGVGSLHGAWVGALLLTTVDAALASWPSVQHFVYGFLLLFALFVMPNGVVGAVQRLWQRTAGRSPVQVSTAEPVAQAAAATLPAAHPLPAERDLLRVEGVSKAYGGVKPAQDVSFSLKAGHVHALIGPNGAGKSTMINMLTGIVPPDSGRIVFVGESLVGQPAHRIAKLGLARTFQNLRLFGQLSVLDNVLLGQHGRMANGFWVSLLGLPAAQRSEALARQRAMSLLQGLGLSAWSHAPAGSLPYGLQRRVELARALATQPSLLLLDEPAAGLNPQETAELGDLLKRIAKGGVTILMVEHHMDLVMGISDHVIVLDHGLKIAEGPPAEVQRNQAVIEAYLGSEVADA